MMDADAEQAVSMKVLTVSPQPFFSPRGTPLSVYYRALVMAEKGAQIDLLTYGQGQDVEIPGLQIIRIPRFGFLGDVRVGPSLLKLFLDCVLFVRLVGMLIKKRYDFVHAHEEAVFFCLLLQPIFRFDYVYDMHSSLPQQLTSFQFTKSRLLIRLFENLETRALRKAKAVITICQDLYEYANTLMPAEKNVLIENTLFDAVRVVGSDGSGPHLDLTQQLRRRVVYAGTLEPYQGIELLLGAFRTVQDRVDDVELVIAGGTTDQVAEYRAIADKLTLGDTVRFVGSVPRPVASQLNATADVLVSPRITGGNTPLKVYEQLASGIPLVATRIHSHTQVLTDEVAFLAEPNPAAFGEAIFAAMTDESARRARTLAATSLYERCYSRTQYDHKIDRLLELVA